ncbi:MAG: hypothetical protein ACP5TY_13150 [Thermodesulforhabdaceae bacterium]
MKKEIANEVKSNSFKEGKTLHQRIQEYEEARNRIFAEELECKHRSSRKFKKIYKMRKIRKIFRAIKKRIVETVVTITGDNRLYANTSVGGTEVLALLDSGAGANCLGKDAAVLIEKNVYPIMSLRGQNVRTADGEETPLIRIVSLPVEWDGVTKN